jgi:oligopeptide transport system substrate-binding protein
MQLIQADLAKIGIKATLAPGGDFPVYLKTLQGNNWQIGRLGWVADYPIMDNFLFPIFSGPGATDDYSKFYDPKVTAGLEEARTIADNQKAIDKYQEQNVTIQKTNPVIPVMFYAHHDVGSSRVHDLVYDPQMIFHLEKTWLTGGGAK